MILRSINPFTNEIVKEFDEYSEDKVEKLIFQSAEGFDKWKKTTFAYRSSLIKKTAAVLRDNKNEYAAAITEEMGNPIKESISEVEKCAWVCDFKKQLISFRNSATEPFL